MVNQVAVVRHRLQMVVLAVVDTEKVSLALIHQVAQVIKEVTRQPKEPTQV